MNLHPPTQGFPQMLYGQLVVDPVVLNQWRCWEHLGTLWGARSVATLTKPEWRLTSALGSVSLLKGLFT